VGLDNETVLARYGSVLGATFATLFPVGISSAKKDVADESLLQDKVGRIIIDGKFNSMQI
jgi:hypothetical protein